MNIIINELIYVRLFLYINITLIIKSYIHFHFKLLFVLNNFLELVEFHLYSIYYIVYILLHSIDINYMIV